MATEGDLKRGGNRSSPVPGSGSLLDLRQDIRYSPAMPRLKTLLKYLLGIAFALAGANHFFHTAFYVSIVPAYLPWHAALVYVSGVCAVFSGILLLVPGFSRLGAWAIIAVSIAVFPANINTAVHAELFPQFSPAALWLRLPLQAVIIAWAYWYTRPETANA